jgi:glycosyltransferase involved in cell wall biosynthesis
LLRLKVVVTVHTLRVDRLRLLTNRWFLRFAHEIVVVAEVTKAALRLPNVRVLPAFLPPHGALRPLPEGVQRFIDRARVSNFIVMCANASRLVFHNGQDLYGLDLCVELVRLLVHEQGVPACLLFVVASSASGNQLFERARERIAALRLSEHFLLFNGTVDFSAIIKQSDVVLRTTNTDADALTIREAMFFGKPVVASDVVARPAGTIVFRNRSVSSLLEKTMEAIRYRQPPPLHALQEDWLGPYVDLYRR